jgi:multidrug efflux system membrane fusion protein
VKPIAVIFTLPQRDLAVISAALSRGTVKVEVMIAEGRGVLASGTLQTIDNQIDMTTGTIKLKAVFPNQDQKLWPGQFVSTRVVVDTLVDASVVPTTAIRRGPSGTFVYGVGPDDRAVVRPVNVLMQDETRAVVGPGLEIGARVVTVGFAQLADKRPVQVVAGDQTVKPAAGAPGAATSETGPGPQVRAAEPGGHAPATPARKKDATREAAVSVSAPSSPDRSPPRCWPWRC